MSEAGDQDLPKARPTKEIYDEMKLKVLCLYYQHNNANTQIAISKRLNLFQFTVISLAVFGKIV